MQLLRYKSYDYISTDHQFLQFFNMYDLNVTCYLLTTRKLGEMLMCNVGHGIKYKWQNYCCLPLMYKQRKFVHLNSFLMSLGHPSFNHEMK